jgi:2,4-dienoyl-CoA reductase-like NADH-dependent reductase (Old Yellow Enzyme family)/thioredoxin reductase
MECKYPHLFEPFTIKKTRFRNRIFSAPNMMCHMDANGFPTDYMIAYYAEKAKGGAAVVTVGDTPVDHEYAPSNPRSFQLSYESLPFVSELAMAIKAHGAIASLELNHGGCVNPTEAIGGKNPIGPVSFVRWDGVPVDAMDEEMMNHVADNFANAAELLKIAGFDMCMLHGGHGWLLDQFLSPLYNTRSDEYGGSLENRAKFPLMVIDRVRQKVGDDFLIEYRMSGSEEIEGGLSKEEGIAFAQMIDDKVDIIHVSTALDTEEAQAVHTHPTMFLPHGVNVHYAEDIKKVVKSPVVTIGAISDPEMAEQILAEGRADIIGMTRALIADPHFPNKAKAGKPEEIIPCLRCLDCLTGMHTGQHFQCAVNPWTGREFRMRNYIQPATSSKKVMVIGGGPAGMKAAITAAQRGHSVTLVEKSDSLGGLLKFTDCDSLKVDLMRYKNHLIYMTNSLPIEIVYNQEADKTYVTTQKPDAIIIATGSNPITPRIDGIDLPSVKHATTVYTDLSAIGDNVAVIGGGLVGCETGLFVAELGKAVTIIEMQDEIAPEANWMHKEGMMQAFSKQNITLATGRKVTGIQKDGVTVETKDGTKETIHADSVIYAIGMRPENRLTEELANCAPYVRSVGDCVRARKVSPAIYEAYYAAIDIA